MLVAEVVKTNAREAKFKKLKKKKKNHNLVNKLGMSPVCVRNPPL